MFSWFRRPRRVCQGQKRRPRSFRPGVESLEDRRVLAPVIDPLAVPLSISTGKTLIVPVTASNPGGGAVTYSITSSNPAITVNQLSSTNTYVKVSVEGFGDMTFQLFGDLTPNTVTYLTGLIQSEFYDGLKIHRVEQGFVIQGGDPNGDGTGGPPGPQGSLTTAQYQALQQQLQFDDEFNANAIFTGNGQLALAKGTGNDNNGSQFFVTDGQQRSLDFRHTIFGQLLRGFDVLKAIEAVPVVANSDGTNRPVTPIIISNVTIIQDPTDTVFTLKSTAAAGNTGDTITIKATDANGATTSETLPVTTTAATNDPPFLGPVANQVVATGTPATVNLTATDLEGDALLFGLTETDSPANASITPSGTTSDGRFTVTPNAGFTGVIHLQATVTDATATRAPDTQNFTITVGDQAITATPAATIVVAEASAVANKTVATFSDADVTSQPADFKVAINWGDGTALDTTSGKITGAAGQFTVTGTHTYKDPGNYAAKVTVTDVYTSTTGGDNGGATATVTTAVTVGEAGLSGQGAAVSGTQFVPVGNVTVATFTDADPGQGAGHYQATIAWGDGTTSAGLVTAAGTAGTFNVQGNHAYATAGTFTTTVSITDLNPNRTYPAAALTVQGSVTLAPSSTNEAFVTKIYRDLYDRAPDPAGMAFSLQFLNAGGTRLRLATLLEMGPEGRVREVERIYTTFLGRLATNDELTTVVEFLNRGGLLQIARAVVIGSDEYFSKHGSTNAGFAAAAFSDLLGHPLNQFTQDYLTEEMKQGASRVTVANWLMTSNEGLAVRVLNIFLKILKRPNFPIESQTYGGQIHDGLPEEQLIADLISVPEYNLHP